MEDHTCEQRNLSTMAVNKIFVMLPVMLATRKLDGEDPNIVLLLRCLYGAVQMLTLILVLFVYTKASAAAADKANDVLVYVPPPPQRSWSRQLNSVWCVHDSRPSPLEGNDCRLGHSKLHGSIQLVQKSTHPSRMSYGGIANLKEKRIFGEKRREEIDESDLVTDNQGNTILLKKTASKSKKEAGEKNGSKSFEDILLDTWDLGEEADIAALMSTLMKKIINNATKENAWTPIMILSGLGASGVG
eukprot:CCRYP_020539-RC/>CCRYP_020539-RC protein AED:0.46 eAED:0.46 QI:23/0/0.5/1/1/1/2/0/244